MATPSLSLPFTDKYLDITKFPNPSDKDNPELKMKKDWFLKRIQWGYSSYLNNNFAFPYASRPGMVENRLYGQGMQPIEKYMDKLCPVIRNADTGLPETVNGTNQVKRRGYLNINWDILAIAPKYRDRVVGMFMKLDFNIGAYAVDELSDDERNMLKYSVWAEQKEAEFLGFMDAIAGTEPPDAVSQMPFMPSSLEEMQMLSKMGCFKLGKEIALEEVLDLTWHVSKWNTEIKKQLYEDFYDLGCAAVKDYYDPVLEELRTRYVDPMNLLVHETRSNTFKHIDWAAEVVPTSIVNIKELAPELSIEELERVASTYSSMYGNPYYSSYAGVLNTNPTQFDNFQCAVLDGEFCTFDLSVYKFKKTPDGDTVPFKEKFNYSGESDDKKKVFKQSVKQWYRFKWIVGTDIIYDWGYQHNVARDKGHEARSSFHKYRCAGKSIGERTKTVLDQLQLNYLRIQDDIIRAPRAGIAIEVKSIKNIELGGQLQDPRDILALYHTTGDLLWSATSHNQSMLNGGHRPIDQLEGGIGRSLAEKTLLHERNLAMLDQITGLSAAINASQPSAEQGLGITQIAQNATNDVLFPLLAGYQFLKEETAINTTYRAQMVSRFKKLKGYLPGIGESLGKFIEIGDEISLSKMGIKIEAIVDDLEKQKILLAAETSLAAAKAGQAGIKLSDYFFIVRSLNHGNLKMCEVFLSYKENKYQQEALQAQAQNQQINNQSAMQMQQQKDAAMMQSNQQLTEAELQKINAQAMADVMVKQKESEFRVIEDAHKHQNKMKEIALQAELKPEPKAAVA